jgi:hypothetical protein
MLIRILIQNVFPKPITYFCIQGLLYFVNFAVVSVRKPLERREHWFVDLVNFSLVSMTHVVNLTAVSLTPVSHKNLGEYVFIQKFKMVGARANMMLGKKSEVKICKHCPFKSTLTVCIMTPMYLTLH